MERTNTQVRTVIFEVDGERTGDAEIPVVISTQAVVEMPDGPEILIHTREAVDLSRAPLPIIATHKGGQVNVGIIDGIEVVGGKMTGRAKFGARAEAKEYETDVRNKIIRSISVGYGRSQGYVRKDGVLVTTKWTPSHAAMVAEPGDVNAGFFRSKLEIVDEPKSEVPAATAAPHKESAMTTETTVAATATAEVKVDPPAYDPVKAEAQRREGIGNLCKANKIADQTRDHWITSGTSWNEVSTQMLQIMEERGKANPQSAAHLGLTPRETQTFSLTRAITAVADKNWNAAGFEAECSRAIAQKLGKQPDPNKFYVPYEVQDRQNRTPVEEMAYRLAKRDLTVATAGAGGFLVETTNVGFIELLRARSVLFNMGARRLSGLVGSVSIPKQTVAATPVWLANEASTITESQQTFVQIALSPKNVGGYTEISRQLLLQSNPSIEGIVMTDLATVVALDIDKKGLNGSAAGGEPQGIIGTSGVGAVTGTSLAYAGIIEFQTDVFAGNALSASSGYVTTGVVAGLLKARVKFSSTASPIWDGRLEDATVDGYRGMASNQVPTGDMIFGDFGQVIVAEWGVLEVEVNPYANFQAGIIGVRAIASIDIAVRQPTAFSIATSIT